MILTNPTKAVPLRTEVLQNLFDLTAAEARLAARLCAGESDVPEIAKEFGVSVSTLRTQIRSVYGKTGVRRQLDLARLLISTETVGHSGVRT
jgi:DNA-binding CsgD family transcriptional regulator